MTHSDIRCSTKFEKVKSPQCSPKVMSRGDRMVWQLTGANIVSDSPVYRPPPELEGCNRPVPTEACSANVLFAGLEEEIRGVLVTCPCYVLVNGNFWSVLRFVSVDNVSQLSFHAELVAFSFVHSLVVNFGETEHTRNSRSFAMVTDAVAILELLTCDAFQTLCS